MVCMCTILRQFRAEFCRTTSASLCRSNFSDSDSDLSDSDASTDSSELRERERERRAQLPQPVLFGGGGSIWKVPVHL